MAYCWMDGKVGTAFVKSEQRKDNACRIPNYSLKDWGIDPPGIH